MNRHELLLNLHQKIKPRTYLEVGVHKGQSLTLSRVPTVGVDPEFNVVEEVRTDLHLARTTSDEFFARPDPLSYLPRPVLDFAFIDGMHLSEYALRDYLGVERYTEATSVIVFDDMLPRNVLEANRRRASAAWTGDVYKAARALREMCPDLIVIDVNTAPTGTVVVLLPDAGRDGVLPGYDDWLDIAMAPDPQDVPPEILKRTNAVKPERLLKSRGWSLIRMLRGRNDAATRDLLRDAFADVTPPR